MDRTGRKMGGRRRLLGIGGFALTAVITAFHGGLLWQRLTDGSLLQPVVVVRWLVSALLVFALLQLWSRGLPILRGRRAGVLWLVVVLLHAFTPGASLPAVEPVAGSLLPVALAMLAFLAFGVVAAASGDFTGLRQRASRPRSKPWQSSSGWYRVLFCRPPPGALLP